MINIERSAHELLFDVMDLTMNQEHDLREKIISLCEQVRAEERARCVEIADRWRKFYKSMQDKSEPGEKDGMYRMFAAEDILKEILNYKEPTPTNEGE